MSSCHSVDSLAKISFNIVDSRFLSFVMYFYVTTILSQGGDVDQSQSSCDLTQIDFLGGFLKSQ